MEPGFSLRTPRIKRKREFSDQEDDYTGVGELQIGQIRYHDILRSGRYKLPPDVKKAAQRWMRTKDVVRSNKDTLTDDFSKLCSDLGFSDPKYPENFRNLCILKLEAFIGNEGRRLRGVAFVEDATTGERTWAPWTAGWIEDDWDGDTAPPAGGIPQAQQVEITQQLEDAVAGLHRLIPHLSVEEVERLIDSQFKLFMDREVSARVAKSITTWTEASLGGRSVLEGNEAPTELMHGGREGHGNPTSGHEGTVEGAQKSLKREPGEPTSF